MQCGPWTTGLIFSSLQIKQNFKKFSAFILQQEISNIKHFHYLDTINEVIKNIKKQNALIIYREDSVDEIHDSEIVYY